MAEVVPVGFVADLVADQKLLEWAGIGFGEIESYRIMRSLKGLAKESGSSQIRFFGKIFGTERDYYVAEGVLDGGDEGGAEGEVTKPADQEARGSGINKFVYWVTDSVLERWIKLPDLSPAELNAARQVKVILTGDLERPIFTNPFFFGREKHYLRAQISRIIQSTTIVPKGIYKLVEDNNKEIEEDPGAEGEAKPVPTALSQAKADNWVHYNQSILLNGRVSHIEPEGDDEGNLMKALLAADPLEPRLKPINQDREVVIGGSGKHALKSPSWSVRLLGDTTEYFNPVKPSQKINNGVVVVRSLHWPGSYTLFQNGRTLNIYVGNAHKYEGGTAKAGYFPLFPPKVMEDPAEFKEQPEPTPLTLEVPVQA